jgi:2-oxoglutarate ferredoxin oxidoreductase subunit gamma
MPSNGLCEQVIIAGSGGQGIMLAGKLLAQTAMEAGKEVTYMPSYGAEVRGGTANCMVVISDSPIASPLVTTCGSAIIMNTASMKRFAGRVADGGLLVMNSSLVDQRPESPGIKVVAVPADELAVELGSQKAANMIALGAYFKARGLFTAAAAAACLERVLARRYHHTVPLNRRALERGAGYAEDGGR